MMDLHDLLKDLEVQHKAIGSPVTMVSDSDLFGRPILAAIVIDGMPDLAEMIVDLMSGLAEGKGKIEKVR